MMMSDERTGKKNNSNNETNKQKANVIEIKIKPTEHVAQKQIV